MAERARVLGEGSRTPLAAQEFTLRVYSRRWGHDDIYKLWRTASGWMVHFIKIGGQCDPSGKPYLYENLAHDGVAYPQDLPQRMHRLWREAPMMSHDEIQARLEVIANHLRAHEKAMGGRGGGVTPE